MLFKKYLTKYTVVAAVFASLLVVGINSASAHEGSMHADDVVVPQPVLSAEEKNVVKMLERYALAVQSTDVEQIEKFVVADDGFTNLEGANQEDGVFLDIGWQNYRKHLADELPMLKDYRYDLSNIRPFVLGDLAYASMDWLMNFTIESDQFESGKRRLTMKGKATVVMQKLNDEWKIRHRHTILVPVD